MGVVIDSNSLACVFCKTNSEHQYFIPLLKWIIEDKAKIIIGGSTYISELEKAISIYKLILELNRCGKVFVAPKKDVDAEESRIKSMGYECHDFDDPHIVALIVVSSCKVLCSNDLRSFPFVQMRCFYPKGKCRPKIYTSAKRQPAYSLLKDENLSACCFQPLKVLSKKEIEKLEFYKA